MIRVAIVEDNVQEADALAACLERYGTSQNCEFSVRRYTSAMEFVEERPSFDLVFMDIELPGINGMEAAQLLRDYDETVAIVFVTSLAQYAVRGYSVEALDFIVKPVTWQAVAARLDRVIRLVRRRARRSVQVKTRDGIRRIETSRLEFVEVTGHYLLYHEEGVHAPFQARGTMAAAEAELAIGPFVRISNSCLVNMDHIMALEGDSLVLASGERLYFSRAKRRVATETIANYFGGDC